MGSALSYRYQARHGCRWMPGVYAQPRPLQTVVRSTCLSTGRGLPLVFREEPGVSRVARVMPCPLVIWIRGTRHLPPFPPSRSHNPSRARRPPIFASVQFLPMDPGSTLALGIPFQQPHTHSCPRLFLTVPRHHYKVTPGILTIPVCVSQHLVTRTSVAILLAVQINTIFCL